MQSITTTAIYDPKRKVVIPETLPPFTEFQEVHVVFVPIKKKKSFDNEKAKQFLAVENLWSKNQHIDLREAEKDIKKAIQDVRSSKIKHLQINTK